jgi:prevent-host-death family protein
MKTVGLKILKNKLSEYIRAAASGETIVVTDRGRPVVEINPARQVPDRYKNHPVLARGIREAGSRRRASPTARRRRATQYRAILSSSCSQI